MRAVIFEKASPLGGLASHNSNVYVKWLIEMDFYEMDFYIKSRAYFYYSVLGRGIYGDRNEWGGEGDLMFFRIPFGPVEFYLLRDSSALGFHLP